MNKHTLKIFLICVTLLLVAAAQPVLGSDWAQFQKDTYNSGITNEAGPISNNGSYAFAVLTKSSGMSGIDTTPVVVDDVVYTVAQGVALAFNKTTGDQIWNHSVGGGFTLATPVVADGKLFAGSNNGIIAALNISTGAEVWINSTGLGGEKAQVNTPIVYDAGNIYFGTWFSSGNPGSYYCLNATDGSFVWERACTSSAGYYWAGACVVGDYLVYGGDDGHLVSVNKYTGMTMEDVSTGTIFSSGTGNIRSSMSYDQSTGRLYFAAGSSCYYVGFDSGTGTFVKSVKGSGTMTGSSTSTPAVYNDRAYVGCGGSLYCLDADTLETIWFYTVGAQVQSSPAISTYYDDGNGEIYIYFTTNDASCGMYCLKDIPGNTEPIVRFEFFPPGSMKQYSLQGAAISDGMVYYGNDAGYLFALADPEIHFTANTTYGSAPLTVQFTDYSVGSTAWQWDFDNDGNVDSTERNPIYTYSAAGNYSVNLTINKSTGSVQELKTDYITVIEAKPLEDYLTYTSDSSSITITGYTGPAGDLVIPDEIDGLPVTKIADRVFQGTPLTSVVIPDSVTNIGLYQFQNCEDLISIYTGGVPSISTNNIRNCPSLETITVGHRLSSITSYSIRDCPSLDAMVFEAEGDAPSASGNWNYNCPNLVVYYCENATSFTTPSWAGKPCYPIGSPTADFSTNAISGSAPLTVQFTYSGVGANALSWYFDGDATVDSTARNPSYTYDTPGTYSATLYVSNPWGSDSKLSTNYITVTEARADGWAYTSDGTSVTVTGYSGSDSDVTIPGEIDGLPVTTIGASACKALTSLTSVTIPDSVTNIDASAFYGCTNLTSVTIPDSVTNIGSSAFYGCTGLISVTIPDSVTNIDNSAFRGCTGLDSLTIGNGVTTIGSSAFYGCTGLTSVTIPNSVTTIDTSAFYGCTNLTVMMFNGNAPTTVGSNWASGTNLVAYYSEGATNFTTPEWNEVPCYPALTAATAEFTSNSVYGSAPLTVQFTYTGVGANAMAWDFGNDGTVDSTARNPGYTYDVPGTYSIKLNVSNPWGSDSEVKTAYVTVAEQVDNFTYTSDGTSVTITGYSGPGGDVVIPSTIGDLPVTAISGSVFKSNTNINSVTIPDSVTTIGSSAFYGCTGLTSVTIPNSVTTIGNNAFNGCTGLTSVTIGNNVTKIDDRVFYGCTALISVVIPDSVTSIGDSAFYQCSNLASVTIPDSVTTIDSYAFRDCTALTSVTIPDSVTNVESRLFYGCTGLTSVTIGIGLDEIPSYMFYGCSALTSVTIPDNVTEIGINAFRKTALTSVTIGNNVTTIGSSAFRDCTALTSMVFTGDAPSSVSSSWVDGCPDLVAYYYEDATGFTTPTWNGVACYPLTAAPVADFEADVTSGIGPMIVNFTDQSTGIVSSYAWDFDSDGTVDSTEQNPSYTYISAGTFTVNLTVANANGTDSEVKTDYITVSEPSTPAEPVAAFTADVTSGTAPLTVNFTDQSSGTPTAWAWDFDNDGNVDSSEQNPGYTYNAAGNYTVNLTVENAAGTDFELKSDYIEVSEASGSTVTLYFDPESSSVSENEFTEINILASNFPAGLSGYNLTVAIDDPAVAEIVDIEYPTWALITQNSTLPGSSIYMKTVDLEDAVQEGAANVVLATLTVSGKEKGSANLSIGVKRLEEDSGDSIEPALLAGTIEVTPLSPLPDQEYAPKDLDGDGLYEDLTGNGEFSFVDIVAYFHNMDWIEENMPVEYFDFNGNGRIDFDDVVDMFAMI
ncbi:leucine-rich repeat protein [Methanosarcina acetivorans]|uniref:Cell surface protein n=1 Tax=Methanosarcina acetivorans (strain ATCC 35395 / DSM 2834 / JCM 12185 / C2A) TaxID=188937 RepID=Q8TI71_METAC|nr:leucine-rich repeat protein [Methanosarcina acetivorans]AAM07629.1 cell surface protein [Methanosarcina acetivorans C2A]